MGIKTKRRRLSPRCAVRARTAPLFEQLLRGDRDPICDLGRPVENLQDFLAQRAAKFARTPAAGGQFDPAVARIASRADHVTFSHRMIMRDDDDCSKTSVPGKLPQDDNSSRTVRAEMTGSRNVHRWNFVLTRRTTYFGNVNPAQRVTGCVAAVCNGANFPDALLAWSRQSWREIFNWGASGLARAVQEAGHRDSRSDRALHEGFGVPLTVRVGKFFKSWVQGFLVGGWRIRPAVARRTSF